MRGIGALSASAPTMGMGLLRSVDIWRCAELKLVKVAAALDAV